MTRKKVVTMTKEMQEVQTHAEMVRQQVEGTWLFTGLYGSQNYGLATETSDVDTHSMVLPTFENLCFSQRATGQLTENVHYKDVREMCRMWEKQSVNFLETLFSDSMVFNHEFAPYMLELFAMREEVARLNPMAFLSATYGTVFNNLKTAVNTRSTKKLARAQYFLTMADKYKQGMPFKDVLQATPAEKAQYLAFRAGFDTDEEFDSYAETLHTLTECNQQWVQSHKFETDVATAKKLRAWELDLLTEAVKMEW